MKWYDEWYELKRCLQTLRGSKSGWRPYWRWDNISLRNEKLKEQVFQISEGQRACSHYCQPKVIHNTPDLSVDVQRARLLSSHDFMDGRSSTGVSMKSTILYDIPWEE